MNILNKIKLLKTIESAALKIQKSATVEVSGGVTIRKDDNGDEFILDVKFPKHTDRPDANIGLRVSKVREGKERPSVYFYLPEAEDQLGEGKATARYMDAQMVEDCYRARFAVLDSYVEVSNKKVEGFESVSEKFRMVCDKLYHAEKKTGANPLDTSARGKTKVVEA